MTHKHSKFVNTPHANVAQVTTHGGGACALTMVATKARAVKKRNCIMMIEFVRRFRAMGRWELLCQNSFYIGDTALRNGREGDCSRPFLPLENEPAPAYINSRAAQLIDRGQPGTT